jgi:hypothetical protein
MFLQPVSLSESSTRPRFAAFSGAPPAKKGKFARKVAPVKCDDVHSEVAQPPARPLPSKFQFSAGVFEPFTMCGISF